MFSSKSVASPMARVLRRALMGAWGVGLMGLSAGAAAQAYSVLDLGTLGGSSSWAYGINASGQVAGYSERTGYRHAFITGANGKGMTDLGTLGELPL